MVLNRLIGNTKNEGDDIKEKINWEWGFWPGVQFRMANPHGTKLDSLLNRKSDTEDEVTDEMNNKEPKENGYIHVYSLSLMGAIKTHI